MLYENAEQSAQREAKYATRNRNDSGDQQDYIPTPDDLKANGCVGVLELTNADYTLGSFCHPWLTGNLVADEIERINVFHHQGHIDLFVVAHGDQCALLSSKPDLLNWDFMLGF